MTRINRSLVSLFVGYFIFGSAIAGCVQPTTKQPQITPATPTAPIAPPAPSLAGVQQWTTLLKGESAQDLTFTQDGQLVYQGKPLLNKIPVSYISDGNVTYAQRLIVSNPSPSGRFSIVKACEEKTNESGLCWAVFLVDRQAQSAQRISISKYGGQEWVQWTTDEHYAVFSESMEGSTWFTVLNLQTRETKTFEDYTAAVADLSSFRWTSNRTFQINFSCGTQANCTEKPVQRDITTLFTE